MSTRFRLRRDMLCLCKPKIRLGHISNFFLMEPEEAEGLVRARPTKHPTCRVGELVPDLSLDWLNIDTSIGDHRSFYVGTVQMSMFRLPP